ncbi:LINE-1 retrotransposable element ORF2 protein [Chionoecetes opilio]|uniref:LINE-1 retrotransposable element ORF2 protein n=1 Tax=Chionoecetes opilio TaxID=41210 RepID=A0A8J4YB51_CHIOP|nr:LINE-1 retrotransposable element ORF2 protein [Chionoecetes opilio]
MLEGKLKFGDDTLAINDSINILGVEVDSRLSFDRHLETVARRASLRVTLLRPVRHLLDAEGLMRLYKAQLQLQQQQQQQRLQQEHWRDDPRSQLDSLGHRRRVSALTVLHKAQVQHFSHLAGLRVPWKMSERATRTVVLGDLLLEAPRTNTVKGQRAFTWATATLWNAFTVEVDVVAMNTQQMKVAGPRCGETSTGGYTYYWSGMSNGHRVAIGISSKLQPSVVEVTPVDECIMRVRMKHTLDFMSLVAVYAPTEMRKTEAKEMFYAKLDSVLDQCPSRDTLIVLGDFNATTGTVRDGYELCVGPHGSGTRNTNSSLLLNFARSRRLRIAGSWYQRPELHRWTWYSNAGGVAKEIDHILKLKDLTCAHEYAVAVSNRFDVLGALGDPVELWDTFKRETLQAAKECIGERPRSRRGFVSTETLEKIEESRAARLAGNQDQHRALSRRTRTLLGKDKERYVRSLAEDVEGHLNANDLRPAYRALKKLRSKSPSRASAIRTADGRLVSDMDGQMARWAEYFGQLFTVDPPTEQLHTTGLQAVDADPPIDETAPSLDEVREAVAKLRGGKAAGVCNISAELLKAGGEAMIRGLHAVLTAVWQSGTIPPDWKRGLVVPIWKGKGDRQDCNNYRSITLFSVPGKVLAHLLLTRIRSHLVKHQRPQQSGFTPGKSTTDRILALRVLVEHRREFRQGMLAAYVDLKKAFDSVHRVSSFLPVKTGVRQGCVIAPSLFNACMDWVLDKVVDQSDCGASVGSTKITDLVLADDVVIFAESLVVLVMALEALHEEAKPLGLEVSWLKTKVQVFGDLLDEAVQSVHACGEDIEILESFTYHSSAVHNDGGSRQEVLRRIGIAHDVMDSLTGSIWRCRYLCRRTKIRIFKSLVIPVLPYGCETWTLNSDLKRRINAFDVRRLPILEALYIKEINPKLYVQANDLQALPSMKRTKANNSLLTEKPSEDQTTNQRLPLKKTRSKSYLPINDIGNRLRGRQTGYK